MIKPILALYIVICAATVLYCTLADPVPVTPGPADRWEEMSIILDNRIAEREIIQAWDLMPGEAD